MATEVKKFENRLVRLQGDRPAKDLFLKCARVEECLSTLTRTTVEFLVKDRTVNLKDVVGYPMNVSIDTADKSERKFLGTCISAEFVGLYQGFSHFVAEVRPWPWFLTLRQDCRIFQQMKVTDIIQKVFKDAGFNDFKLLLNGTYVARDYCVQYRETDFAFISRLMEEEGIYYFFTHEGEHEQMVLADDIGAHTTAPGGPEFEFQFREQDEFRRDKDHIFEWTTAEVVTPGKVMLTDYNFEKPSTDLKKPKQMPKGNHSHNKMEIYDYPGQYREDGPGVQFARVEMESYAIKYQAWRGAGNVRTLGVGHIFSLSNHPRTPSSQEFVIGRATHLIQIETEWEEYNTLGPARALLLDFGPGNHDIYRIIFDCHLKTEPFRAPKVTPWPEIAGMHTATVVGPKGEEIYTDEYGRIKVQFHWDRVGKNDENSSCWVRTVMPWTGKNWGMIAIPRIGQEVAIMFEEGNPDRPICTGMLYNAETMPPYALDANKTQSGIKTRSSKKGGEKNYNELLFEDKKGEEFIRIHAEKDFKQVVENNADIEVGVEKMDPGTYTQTIYGDKTETIKIGNSTFLIEKGDETYTVAEGKQTTKIKGDTELTVTDGDHKTTVSAGNQENTVSTGNQTNTISTGNQTTTVSAGDITTEASAGKISVTAAKSIELKVGGSSIKIEPAKITIKSTMISIEAQGQLKAQAGMAEIKSSGILTLQGSLTKIN